MVPIVSNHDLSFLKKRISEEKDKDLKNKEKNHSECHFVAKVLFSRSQQLNEEKI